MFIFKTISSATLLVVFFGYLFHFAQYSNCVFSAQKKGIDYLQYSLLKQNSLPQKVKECKMMIQTNSAQSIKIFSTYKPIDIQFSLTNDFNQSKR